MKKLKYVLSEIHWYCFNGNSNKKFDLQIVPFVFNKDKTKIKTLFDNKIYPSESSTTDGMDTMNKIYSKKGLVFDSGYMIDKPTPPDELTKRLFSYSELVTLNQIKKIINCFKQHWIKEQKVSIYFEKQEKEKVKLDEEKTF